MKPVEDIKETLKTTIINRQNIDEKLDYFAHILTILVEIKKQYNNDDDDEIDMDISDAESLVSVMSDDE